MTAQWDLSRILQMKIERHLAGLAIIYPIEVLQAFEDLEIFLIDPVAIGWLQYLNRRKRDLRTLDDERKRTLTYALLIGFNGGEHQSEIINCLNQTSNEYEPVAIVDEKLVWSEYSPSYLIDETEKRIREQHYFREGLADLTQFTVGYLESAG